MKLKNIIAFLLIVVPLVAFAKPLTTKELEIKELSISMQIDYFAVLYGIDSSVVSKVIQCESEGKVTAMGDGGRSYGIAQFQKETFLRMEKKLGEDLNYDSAYDQIKLLSFAISEGWGNEWTTYRAIQNGGKYSFYSKQLKKHFTVICR